MKVKKILVVGTDSVNDEKYDPNGDNIEYDSNEEVSKWQCAEQTLTYKYTTCLFYWESKY